VRKPKPDKGEYSHGADALQYACLASGGQMHAMISGRVLNGGARQRRERTRFSGAAWT
jgi:hypothetical protein